MARKKAARKSGRTASVAPDAGSQPATPADTAADPAPDAPAAPEATQFQRFVIERLHRSDINPAPYNPNVMDPYAFRKLKANLKAGRIGLLEPLIWNRRTGNLVSGHHRLRALDELNRSTDYYLDVAVVELDARTEREQNIALNNPAMQGRYDMTLLDTMLHEDMPDSLALGRMGMDEADLENLYADSGLSSGFLDSMMYPEAVAETQAVAEDINAVLDEADDDRRDQRAAGGTGTGGNDAGGPGGTAVSDAEPEDAEGSTGSPSGPESAPGPVASNGQPIDELKARKKAHAEEYGTDNEVDFTLVIVARSDAEKRALCRMLNHPETSAYIAAEKLAMECDLDLAAAMAAG